MATIDFKTFAAGVGANVLAQPDYVAAVWRDQGWQPGILPSAWLNKTARQSAFVTAAIAEYVSRKNGDADVLDNGDLEAFITLLTSGISIGASIRPARLVPSSAALIISANDYALGLNRTVALAAMDAQLPADAQEGQEFVIEDLIGNLTAFPVRVLPPSGTIANRADYTMNEDKQSAKFRRYAGNLWSVAT